MEEADTSSWEARISAVLSKEVGTPYGGARCLRVTVPGEAAGFPSAYQNGKFESERTYLITGWARSDGNAVPKLYFDGAVIWTGTVSTKWQKFSVEVTTPASPELLVDNDMEQAAVGSWTAGASATLTKELGDPYEGTLSLRVERNGENNPFARQTVLTGATSYHIKGWARGDDTDEPAIYTAATELWTGAVDSDWQRVDEYFKAAATTIDFHCRSEAGAQTADFDNFYLNQSSVLDLTCTSAVEGEYCEFDNVTTIDLGYWKPYLNPVDVTIDEEVDFTAGSLDVGSIELSATDVNGEIIDSISPETWGHTVITESLTETDTTINVDVDIFPDAPFTAYIGQETVRVTEKLLKALTVERAAYRSQPSYYTISLGGDSAVLPKLRTYPVPLWGRKCYLYLKRDDETDAECIYRGIVGSVEDQAGQFLFEVNHIVTRFEEKIAAKLPSTKVRSGYYYSGIEHRRSLATTEVAIMNGSTVHATWLLPVGRDQVYDGASHPDGGDGFFPDHETLAYAWNEIANDIIWIAAPVDGTAVLTWNTEDEVYELKFSAGVGVTGMRFTVRRGDVLHALGFEETSGLYVADSGDVVQAKDPPRFMCVDFTWFDPPPVGPLIPVERTTGMLDGAPVFLKDHPGAHIAAAAEDEMDEADTKILCNIAFGYQGDQFYAHSADTGVGRGRRGPWAYVVDADADDDKKALTHCINFGGVTLRQIILFLFRPSSSSADDYLGVHPSWRVPGIASEDLDLDELDDLMGGIPSTYLDRSFDSIRDKTTVGALVFPRLGLLGIAPRLKAEGVIGFARLNFPTDADAVATELDDEIYEYFQQTDVRSSLTPTQMLTEMDVKHYFNYSIEKWPKKPLTITGDNGINQLGKTFGINLSCRGLMLDERTGFARLHCYRTETELLSDIMFIFFNSHFMAYGGQNQELDIPVTDEGKQFLVGDVVTLTHPHAPNVVEGQNGFVADLSLVTGRSINYGGAKSDTLSMLVFPFAAGEGKIAPCALGTAWNVGELKLTFGDVTLYSAADLTEFAVDDLVSFRPFDSSAGSGLVDATITDIDGAVVTLDLDPMGGGGFPADGIYMYWPEYDDASAAQQGWLYFCNENYILGAVEDDGYKWGF